MDNIIPRCITEVQTELESIRGQSSLYLKGSPGRSSALERIAALELRLKKLQETSDAINTLLAGHSVTSIEELSAHRTDAENTLHSTGNRLWQELVCLRGEGKYHAGDCRTSWLPSDLCKIPEFKSQEDQARKEIAAAQKALPTITTDLSKISQLVEEAMRA
jgi:hypothetical protein